MKIEELHDKLEAIGFDIEHTTREIEHLNMCLEEESIDEFNKHICKGILAMINKLMDNSQNIIEELSIVKDTVINIRDGL